jgi:chromatin segregation and condensation protein Rec8/ScpA/Scc1 (kleisin family)
LFDENKHTFSSLFEKCSSTGEIVAVFLALLQLVHAGRINVLREDEDIYLILIKNKEAVR